MTIRPIAATAAVALAAAALLGACDKSRQSADGTTAPNAAGTAATASGVVADTGSPEQNGANGTPSGKGVINGMTTDASGKQPSEEPPMGATHPTKGP